LSKELEDAVLVAMSSDFVSKSVLRRRLGVGASLEAALSTLVQRDLIEGISLSGGDDDHFALTEKGRALVEGLKRPVEPSGTGEGERSALRAPARRGKGRGKRAR
jgi:DNA-binding PadR family transcriptional regulator